MDDPDGRGETNGTADDIRSAKCALGSVNENRPTAQSGMSGGMSCRMSNVLGDRGADDTEKYMGDEVLDTHTKHTEEREMLNTDSTYAGHWH